MSETEDLKEQVAALQKRVVELEQAKPIEQKATPSKPFIRQRRQYDPLDQVKMPPSAVAAMTSAVPDRLMAEIVSDNKRAANTPAHPAPAQPEKQKVSGWQDPSPLAPPAGIKVIDAMLSAQDKIDKADREAMFNKIKR